MTRDTIARLRISLNDIKPEIWRTIERPVSGSLKMLHDVAGDEDPVHTNVPHYDPCSNTENNSAISPVK